MPATVRAQESIAPAPDEVPPGRSSDVEHERPVARKRLVLLAVAALLTAAAALAIGILLLGDFGSTEGRVLATTALLAGYGLLTLPAAALHDQRRAPALAAAVLGLALAAASLAIAAVWSDAPDALGKALGSANAWLVAGVVPAALMLRRRARDPRAVRFLFAASSALGVVLASMFTVLVWAELDSERLGRIVGALLVLEVLLVALQPILARARRDADVHRLRVRVAAGGSIELAVEAPDLPAAAAKAIRAAEREGHRVLGLDVTGAGRAPARNEGARSAAERAA